MGLRGGGCYLEVGEAYSPGTLLSLFERGPRVRGPTRLRGHVQLSAWALRAVALVMKRNVKRFSVRQG